MKKTNSVLASAITSVLLLSGHAIETSHAQTMSISFDMPSQPLVEALRAIANQTQQNVFFDPQVVAGHQAPALKAALSAEEALERALSGSGLTYRRIDEKTVSIVPVMQTTSAAAKEKRKASGWVKTAAVDNTVAAANSSSANDEASKAQAPRLDSTGDADAARSIVKLEEVLVTGSHIRGAQDLSSPLIRFDRKDIEASGHATTQGLLRGLPQNFSNVSDTTSLNGSTTQNYDGSAINLRGLGSESTLVLLNGRRLSPAGAGNFVDVSLIPLTAVNRIDVLTDGASAIYGSDAVGGVVNFVLRDDFDGAETRVRYGTVTEGNHDEVQAGQLLGQSWSSGQAMLSYEYYRRTPLDGTDRSFIRPTGGLASLITIPELRRHGALAALSQRLSEYADLNAEVVLSQRDSESAYDIGIPLHTQSEVKQLGSSLGLTFQLGRSWETRLSGQFNNNESRAGTRSVSGLSYDANSNESRLWLVDVAADGPVGRVSGGDVRLAVGSQFRNEEFVEGDIRYPNRLEREVASAYAEMRVPWVGAENRRAGIERLDLTVAGRFEDYSDFGSTFNPKIGIAWSPVRNLNLRGTWGTSFRAPLLSQKNLADNTAYVYPAMFRNVAGVPLVGARLLGSGVNLQPEESTNWTAGFDLSTNAVELSVTYFDIDYQERIRSPFPPGYDVFSVLLDPAYASVVIGNPSAVDVAALLGSFPSVNCFTADGGYISPCTAPPVDEIGVILDERLRNLAGVHMSGLDFSFSHRISNSVGDWRVGLNGQYLLKNSEQLLRGGPSSDQLNDVWRPVDLRLRSYVSFGRGPFSATGTINYTDDYRDRRPDEGPLQRSTVRAWTTVDLTLQYDLGAQSKRFGLTETTLSISAINLFDRDPPFVGNIFGLHFDGVNANPLGRFVAAELAVRW